MTDEHSITDPREMRQRFNEMRRGRSFCDDRTPNTVDVIVRNVNTMAEIRGLSGEDRYTVLAWHLMHMAARLEKMALAQAMLSPPRPIFMASCQHKETQAIDPGHNDGEVLRCVDCGARKKPGSEWSRP